MVKCQEKALDLELAILLEQQLELALEFLQVLVLEFQLVQWGVSEHS